MNRSNWGIYKEKSNSFFTQLTHRFTNYKLVTMATTQSHFNTAWDDLKYVIAKAKKSSIPWNNYDRSIKYDKPIYLRQMKNHILKLQEIVKRLRPDRITKYRRSHSMAKLLVSLVII